MFSSILLDIVLTRTKGGNGTKMNAAQVQLEAHIDEVPREPSSITTDERTRDVQACDNCNDNCCGWPAVLKNNKQDNNVRTDI